jgi:hypothetical protein
MSSRKDKARSVKVSDTFNLLNSLLEEAIDIEYDGKGNPVMRLKQDRQELLKKAKPLLLNLADLGTPVPEQYLRKVEQTGTTEADPHQDSE